MDPKGSTWPICASVSQDTGSGSSYRRLGYEAEPDFTEAEDTGVARSVARAEAPVEEAMGFVGKMVDEA